MKQLTAEETILKGQLSDGGGWWVVFSGKQSCFKENDKSNDCDGFSVLTLYNKLK